MFIILRLFVYDGVDDGLLPPLPSLLVLPLLRLPIAALLPLPLPLPVFDSGICMSVNDSNNKVHEPMKATDNNIHCHRLHVHHRRPLPLPCGEPLVTRMLVALVLHWSFVVGSLSVITTVQQQTQHKTKDTTNNQTNPYYCHCSFDV
jgi:hypothetical protein